MAKVDTEVKVTLVMNLSEARAVKDALSYPDGDHPSDAIFHELRAALDRLESISS